MLTPPGDVLKDRSPPVALYYATALFLGLAFTLSLLVLAWNAAQGEQARAFARETLAPQERLGNRLRELDRQLGQFITLVQQGIPSAVLARLCEQARTREPALDGFALVAPDAGGNANGSQNLCGAAHDWPTREALLGAVAAFPESQDAFPLRAPSGGEGHQLVLAQHCPMPGSVERALMMRIKGTALLQGVPLPPGLGVRLEIESRGPLGRVTLLARELPARARAPWAPSPLVNSRLSEFTNYAVRLELSRAWTPAQLDFGMLASAAILGLGVTLLMLALARARELRIRELALRNAVIEVQVAQQTQELAAARDEALVAARAKSDFLARMSHEIRTPLNAILGSMEALMDTQTTPAQSHLIRMCERAGQGLLVLINDVLDLAKIEAGQLLLEKVEFSPRDVLEEAAVMHTLAAAGKGIELVTDLSASLPEACQGDPVRLRQVLLNLLGNAIKFTHEGEVVLKAWMEEASGTPELPVLHFEVRDTGIGIPPEKLESVFERFAQADSSTTRRYGGTGLGLAISRELMEGMGGRLWAENPAQGGCCLKGSLPLQAMTRAQGWAASGRRVLLVEAGTSQRESMKRALESLGADVRVGADDVSAAGQISASWHPALIVWGLKHDATDPLTALDTLARGCPAPPRLVVLLPALSGDLPARCAAAGVEVGIKPPRRESLLSWLEAGATMPDAATLLPPPAARPASARRSLLLVEDNDDNRQLVHVFLRGQCWDITDAVDGLEAVRLCTEHSFDLVLMDIQMPRMDGHAATHEIRQLERASGRPPARIIALTAHALPEEHERILIAGCDGYLTKPLKKKTLLDFLAAELTNLRMDPTSLAKDATVQADILGHG